MSTIAQKVVVSVVSKNIPLIHCPLGTNLFIKKDEKNRYDDKALSVFARHKNTGKWTFIGYVANNPEYIPLEGIDNVRLHGLLSERKGVCNGKVVEKMDVVYPYGAVATALVVEIDLTK